MKKTVLVAFVLAMSLAGCGTKNSENQGGEIQTEDVSKGQDDTRIIVDSSGREVEIPEKVESIICLNVSTLRYTCYMQSQDLVVGVEQDEKEESISRPYNYLNYELIKDLPIVGANKEHYAEEIIEVDPDVIMMSAYDNSDAQGLQDKTGIPVVLVPGSDKMMDEGAYETLRIMGEVYGKEERAEELSSYMDEIKADLEERTGEVSDDTKPTVYVGGVNFKGFHGLEGTEAGYGPFEAIHARNLVDETGQEGAFNIELEQVLEWDPEVLFIDYNGLPLINEDYEENPDFYNQLTAVKEGEVYSQISFRSTATNLETALADTYYAGTVLYPEEFKDIDPEEKAGEIFQKFLGTNFYEVLKENGYEFRKIQIGER